MELASPLMVGGVAPVKKMCIPVLYVPVRNSETQFLTLQ